jgi:HD-like signal output (HDOD) protein
MAFSTQIITDLKSVATNGPAAATTANAINATALSTAGGANNLTNGSGNYAAAGTTFYAGMMDYLGMVQLAILKAQELAVLLTKITVNTDLSTDATNNALLVKCLNVCQ